MKPEECGDGASWVKPDGHSSVAGLAARYGLDESQSHKLEMLLERLARDETAPTSVRRPEQAVEVHLADSLVALQLSVVREGRRIADIGAGAGFPGLALAVALPGTEMVLVDSQARKCAFMERMVADAKLDNASVVCARVEEWPEGLCAHDMVLARALAPAPVVVEYAAPLLEVGGVLVDWRGRRDASEEQAGEQAAEQVGMERVSMERMEPFPGARDHHLHVYRKVRDTPDRFPRRAGMARKRPLA